jgi:hypothetical protein
MKKSAPIHDNFDQCKKLHIRDFRPMMTSMETSSLDLVYLDRDPLTDLPSAGVCLKANMRTAYAGVQAERLITSPCLSFVELDSEIRRLHAELDEIRARAKKKFYKAESIAVGAA